MTIKQNRREIIEKAKNLENPNIIFGYPKEDLNKNYLDYCMLCGKKFTLKDKITFKIKRSLMGNSHKSCTG